MNRSEADECMAMLKADRDIVLEQVYPDLNETEREKVAATDAHEAKMDYLGKSYAACYDAAVAHAEKEWCKMELETKKEVSGLSSESSDDVLRRFYGTEIAHSVVACIGVPGDQCRAESKAVAVQGGMKNYQYAAMRQIGEIEEAARAWFTCKINANMLESDCEAASKAAYEMMSGTTDVESWNRRKDQVKKLGEAKRNGVLLELRRIGQMNVEVETAETNCTDENMIGNLTEILRQEVLHVLGTEVVRPEGRVLTRARVHGDEGCRIVDGKVELRIEVDARKMTPGQIDAVSADLAPRLSHLDLNVTQEWQPHGRLLQARRLDKIQNSYSAQSGELCVPDDAECAVFVPFHYMGDPDSASYLSPGITSRAWRYVVDAVVAMLLVATVLLA
jgi:hypothetical protein